MKNTKTNANPKKNIFMSENIGQRRIVFPGIFWSSKYSRKKLAFFVRYFQRWGCLFSDWHLFYIRNTKNSKIWKSVNFILSYFPTEANKRGLACIWICIIEYKVFCLAWYVVVNDVKEYLNFSIYGKPIRTFDWKTNLDEKYKIG